MPSLDAPFLAPFLSPFRPVEPEMVPLEPDDAAALSLLHGLAFDAPGGGWGAGEFRSLLAPPATFGRRAVRPGRPGAPPAEPRGFVLAREAAGEGEVLTIAVHPAWQGRGLGRLMMEALLRDLYARRASELFLEVDEGNEPALRLYRRLGFREVGKRAAYYGAGGAGAAASAITMRLELQA